MNIPIEMESPFKFNEGAILAEMALAFKLNEDSIPIGMPAA